MDRATSHAPVLVGLATADRPDRWEALGFAVSDGAVELGGVTIVLGTPGPAWAIEGVTTEIDGLATMQSPALPKSTPHPNGATGIDHIVVTTPDFDRTAAALSANGMELRRIRDAGGFRQGFRRIGPAILELVEVLSAPPGPARFWGLVVIVSDFEPLGDAIGEVKDAVQPGRRIATLKRSAGLTQAVAFMTPEP